MFSFLNVFRHTRNKVKVRKEQWHDHIKYIILHKYGECQLNIYDEPQSFGGRACIYSLYVSEFHRRSGVAKILLDAAELLCYRNFITFVYLEWDSEHSPEWLYMFYTQRDYRATRTGTPVILMHKPLIYNEFHKKKIIYKNLS